MSATASYLPRKADEPAGTCRLDCWSVCWTRIPRIQRDWFLDMTESPIQRSNASRILLTIEWGGLNLTTTGSYSWCSSHSLTAAVLNESLSSPTSVIISYHPPIFKPLSSLTLGNPLQTSLLTCAANGISVYSPHTACDAAWGGVNDWLAEGVRGGQEHGDVKILGNKKLDWAGIEEGGEGRVVKLKQPMHMSDLEARIKKHLKISHSECLPGVLTFRAEPSFCVVQVGYPSTSNRLVESVAICAGSGGSMLIGHDADVYFTGEMSHVGFLNLPFWAFSSSGSQARRFGSCRCRETCYSMWV